MFRKARFGALFALVALAATAAFAPTIALATPDKSSPCSNCHGGADVPVTTTLASTIGSTATYDFSAPGADSVAVFAGSTKLATINSATGTFMVAAGATYDVFAVAGPGESDGLGQTSVSPVIVVADTTAPVTASDAVGSYVSMAAINLSATDAGSGVANTYYTVDGGTQMTGTAIAVSTLGSHTITFWSVDVAGNVEAPKTATFTVTAPTPVDSIAPVTASDAVATYVTSAAINLTATDAGSGVANTYYTLDGGTQMTGTAIAVSTVGSHAITFWSVDVAGNIETAKTASFTVTEAPVVDVIAPVTSSDAVATYVTSAAINLTATDSGSGVANTYYTLDGGTLTTGTAIAVSTVGTHTISFYSVDVAGNTEIAKTADFTITEAPVVDVTAPVTTSNAKATYVTSAAINLTATDAGSGVANTYYALDGGTLTTGTAIAVSTVGTHTISFYSVDVAGNTEIAKTAGFTITEAPAASDATTTTLSIHASRGHEHENHGRWFNRHNAPKSVSLSGKLSPGAKNLPISLYIMKSGSTTWELVTVIDTHSSHKSKSSTWNYRFTPEDKGDYKLQVRFAGNATLAPSESRIITVTAH
jgi:hypothetical protein